VFCGTVLGSLALDGKVKLTDPLELHLGDGMKVPVKDGRTLRLIDLVGQTSGLPRGIARTPSPPEDPFSTNTKDVRLIELQKDPYLFPPGTSAFYSNFGYDLLGLALSNAAGTPYAELLKQRLLESLGMNALVSRENFRTKPKGNAAWTTSLIVDSRRRPSCAAT
jgi:serine-type D-Ala-D-Ala carboxypeptidase/endopeptidase